MLKGKLGWLAVTILFLVSLFGTIKAEATSNFDANNWQISWLIKNADFEMVDIEDYGRSAGATNVWYVNQKGVDAWGTSNPSENIEVWQNGNSEGIPAYSGTNFVELNSDGPGAVYQDIKTIPGTTLTWSFAHRGRGGVDTAELLIGAPGNLTPIFSATDGESWGNYSGSYVVPAGQTHTRLTFAPISTSSGNLTIGNFLDDINLYIDIAGAQLGDYVWHDENGNGVQDSGEPATPGVEVQLYDKLDALVGIQTTDNLGGYLFTGLLPGDYRVVFVNPDPNHYTFTKQGIGNKDTNSDPNKDGIAKVNIPTIRSHVLAVDAGLTTLGSAIIQKTDGTKNLAGAHFDVIDSDGLTVTNVTTDANGIAVVHGLIPDQYVVKETVAPTGYQLQPSATPLTIVYDQATPVEISVVNHLITGALTVHKIGDQGQSLANATFNVTTKTGKEIGKLTTNSNGLATLSNLVPGDYLLTELAAPKGYQLNENALPFTIPFNPTVAVNLTVKNTPIPDRPITNTTPKPNTTNPPAIEEHVTPIDKLPQTGESSNMPPLVIGIFLLASGYYLLSRK
ncbi:LPXTG cell wall anchor domain-containing protein [Listeria grandensis]|uniref:LPXTG cell wall anchor domain-containing protein n=1 Tax=Listeria grandensis TaxID=1494963 RepID=UPI00164DA37F|nr:LPXTG cell wall anchor domain-containing protein [Listeria grandensis]MBC6316583.1 LPXTG cell wall anchor domain-containing protein [Listeria grandensis]